MYVTTGDLVRATFVDPERTPGSLGLLGSTATTGRLEDETWFGCTSGFGGRKG
jgi:hypothetical protein